MQNELTFEDELLALLQERTDERRKLETRLEIVKRLMEKCDEDVAALKRVLQVYREKFGLSRSLPEPITPEQKAMYQRLSPKEIVARWADDHGGTLAMNDLCQTMAAIGVYKDSQQAASTLYSCVRRMPDFEKVAAGIYHRRSDTPESQNGHAPTQFALVSEEPSGGGNEISADDIDTDDIPF